MLGSLYFSLYGAVQILAGVLVDFLGHNKLIVFSALSTAIGSFASYIAPTFTMIAIGRALIEAGAGFIFMPMAEILRSWFRKREFTTMIGQ